MKRNTINFVIDSISLIFLLGLAVSGMILRYAVPGGQGQGHGWRGGRQPLNEQFSNQFWSLSRHDWRDLHFWIAIVFVAIMGVHILMHWNWIKSYFKPRTGTGSNCK
jgi:hypothetical protein